ncbi:hypothetical protein K474DRAFT_1643587 [Panus rudis PR-1116 ss-1]|nr:hypothetical protein K474DRAFT_1643587 [Panus rudis PR-1116 ss-1]
MPRPRPRPRPPPLQPAPPPKSLSLQEEVLYQPTDAIISPHFSLYSPSVSRVREPEAASQASHANINRRGAAPPLSAIAKGKQVARKNVGRMDPSLYGENDPLLGPASGQDERKKKKKPFYRPRPLWLVPFAVVASIVRGMTLAPRVQVFTQLSCNAIYGHDVYDHTNASIPTTFELGRDSSLDALHLPIHSILDPAGPHLDRLTFHSSSTPSNLTTSQRITFPAQTSGTVKQSDVSNDDDDEPDPRIVPSRRCLSDPAVQAGAARIQTIMTTTMGALSALTTGWWGHFGERYGRTKVLAASTFGLFLTDLTFILVSTPHSPFSTHGHKLLLISPLIEGLLGGWSTLQGATSAYVSDCTSDGSRAKIFSRFTGMFYLGFSVGPTVGAYLIRHPVFVRFPSSAGAGVGNGEGTVHNGAPTVTSVFYVAALCSFINLLLVLFVFPESLDKKKAKARLLARPSSLHAPNPTPAADPDELGEPIVNGINNANGEVKNSPGFLTKALSPLALFLPKKIRTPSGQYRSDWSLTWLGLSLFGYLLSTGIFQIKYLYAEHVYGWGAETLSYYISWVGGVRAVHTLLIMPWIIASFKPQQKVKARFHQSKSMTPGHSLVTRSTPLSSPAPYSSHSQSSHPESQSHFAESHPHAHSETPARSSKPKPTLSYLLKETSFDLSLIRLSLIIDFLSHTLVTISPPPSSSSSPTSLDTALFVGSTTLSSFGAGLVPAVNSLALCVLQMQVSAGAGRLFGALAVLQAVGQMILGPMLFGLVYSTTVAQYPKTIFVTAAAILLVSIAFVCMIRPDRLYSPTGSGSSHPSASYHRSYPHPYAYQHANSSHPHPHPHHQHQHPVHHHQHQTHTQYKHVYRSRKAAELERGRSRASKELSASGSIPRSPLGNRLSGYGSFGSDGYGNDFVEGGVGGAGGGVDGGHFSRDGEPSSTGSGSGSGSGSTSTAV